VNYIAHKSESWRIDRLTKAATVFCTIVGINRKQLDLLVKDLLDHKGELHVYWIETPSHRFMQAFDDAWKLCGEQMSWHFAPGVFGGESLVDGWGPVA
jgi:hypothetical protein